MPESLSTTEGSIHQELLRIFQAVVIQSSGFFLFADEPFQVGAPGNPSLIYGLPTDPSLQHPLLVRDLQAVLYSRCYAQRLGSTPEVPAPESLALQLSRANRGHERWDPGWQIHQLGSEGRVHVMKGERQRLAMPGEYITQGPGVPAPGMAVTLRASAESHSLQPAFYHMFGETLGDLSDDQQLVRFYLHCEAEMVAELVEYLTGSLNRYQVPFQMKTLNDASLYTRTDAMVLYTAFRFRDIVRRILEHIPPEISERMGASVPLFSKKLARGIGLAEDPKNGESFGMNRSRLTAAGIVDAWQAGDQTPAARARAVAARFVAEGLDLERPHLGPRSQDLYPPIQAAGASA